MCGRSFVGAGVEGGIVEVSEGKILFKNFNCVFLENSVGETFMRITEGRGSETDGNDSLLGEVWEER